MDTDSKALREALQKHRYDSYGGYCACGHGKVLGYDGWVEHFMQVFPTAPASPAGSGASVFAEVVPGRKATNWVETQPPAAVPSERCPECGEELPHHGYCKASAP